AAQAVADFVLTRVWILPQQFADSHDHPRRAKAALQRVVLVKRCLNRMQGTVRAEAFNSRDRRSVRHHRQHSAGFDGLSINVDGTRAALRRIAADMGACQAKIIANQMYQKCSRFDSDSVLGIVDRYGHCVEVLTSVRHLESPY